MRVGTVAGRPASLPSCPPTAAGDMIAKEGRKHPVDAAVVHVVAVAGVCESVQWLPRVHQELPRLGFRGDASVFHVLAANFGALGGERGHRLEVPLQTGKRVSLGAWLGLRARQE